ncbi:Ig kappa chain V-I region Walker [Oryzias melastigma]|uniref:Ig kappa chain V-I region Walker n=1 Tax=Oryzias melastigma TaxID=30732 RepID=A0A834C713_ORYME|nr:Ig kappa chain V-I region Walker [Oryzias melastigma]
MFMMMMMMKTGHFALLLTGVSMAIQIHQSPPALLKEAGGDVQLVCSHQQSDFRVMLWYQQPPGSAAMKLVGYGYVEFRDDAVEEAFRGHFSLAGELSGDKHKNASLFIRNLRAPEHTATYFCAASKPQFIKHPPAADKNLQPAEAREDLSFSSFNERI